MKPRIAGILTALALLVFMVGTVYALSLTYQVEPTTAANWTVYDGNTDDANEWLIKGITTSADSNTTTLSTLSYNVLELYVGCDADANTITLNVIEYSAATPTVATEVRCTEVGTGSDQPRTADSAVFGQTTGTAMYVKDPLRIPVTPGAYIKMNLSNNPDGNCYAVYRLTNQVVNAD